jgi:hypothetical protein
MSRAMTLRLIKAGHTAIWAFFVVAIAAIWLFALRGQLDAAGWAIAIVMVEVAVLGVNQGHCPLSPLAGKYTTNRAANFDIYQPAWLAGRTKPIFGTLLIGGIALTLLRCLAGGN